MFDEHKNRLVLFRNGTIYGTKFNREIDEFEYHYLNPKNVLYHLWEPVYISDGFTLRDFFNLVINYYPLRLIDYFTDCLIDEYKECKESGCLSNEFDYLAFSRVTSYSPAFTTKVGPDESGNIEQIDIEEMVEDKLKFSGLCASLSEDNNKVWGIEFAELEDLLDHEIITDNHHVVIEFGRKEDEVWCTNFTSRYALIDSISLYEFFNTIIFNLSFFGCPSQKREKLNNTNDERNSYESN